MIGWPADWKRQMAAIIGVFGWHPAMEDWTPDDMAFYSALAAEWIEMSTPKIDGSR